MKIYILIHVQDTDDVCDANPTVFKSKEAAYAVMKTEWENAIKNWNFDTSEPATDEHECDCDETSAVIHEGMNAEFWRIEEQELDVQVAVEVEGGLVQNIYANADVYPDVYDLDVSSYPEEGEEDEADQKRAELEELVNTPGWRSVW